MSWAAKPGRRFAARTIDSGIGITVAVLTMWLGPAGRPFAQDLVILAIIVAIEATMLAKKGATLGMLVLDIRVRAFDHAGPVPALLAIRRTVPIALCYTLPIPGTIAVIVMPIVLILSMTLSPFGHAFHERLSHTITVFSGAPARISERSLETWWDPSQHPTMSRWGRVPDLHERRRARSHRLDDVWWLAAIVVAGSVAATAATDSRWRFLWLAVLWIVVFVADETRRISSTGTTPGHEASGFKVVDIRTGEVPSTTRSFIRAVVLAPLLYLPPLQLLLGLWVRASALHRGPHDLAAATVVIEPDYVAPQFQAPPPGWAWNGYWTGQAAPQWTPQWAPQWGPPPPVAPQLVPPPPPPPRSSSPGTPPPRPDLGAF